MVDLSALSDRELQLALHREVMGALGDISKRLGVVESAVGRAEVAGARAAAAAEATAQRVDALITQGREHGIMLRSLDTHTRSNLILARGRIRDLEEDVGALKAAAG